MIHRMTSVAALAAACLTAGASDGLPVSTPRTEAQLERRMAELREQYAPYLRSLPKRMKVRSEAVIEGPWRSRYEAENVRKDARQAQAPDWFGEAFDDSAWAETTVPEWRYGKASGCILWYRTRFTAKPPSAGQRVFLVFAGVDWQAEVWLNGKRLGGHRVYYEPFRFDVTSALKKDNVLAVRVVSGPAYGEPVAFWSQFPFVRSKESRYVRGEAMSISAPGSGLGGDGHGIHREVYLETTGAACVGDLFVRGDPGRGQARLRAQVDAAEEVALTLDVQILPENFTGKPHMTFVSLQAVKGAQVVPVTAPMPDAKLWTPDAPYLYRCRVSLKSGDAVLDGRDVLFGHRSFGMVSEHRSKGGLPAGMFLLNGERCYLRGTNIHGLNALWYWDRNERIVDILLMLKAAHFNMVRACQHVQYPEVRELQDRLGVMSQQDQGGGRGGTHDQYVDAAGALARICYNNPGVVLISYANETGLRPTEMLQTTLKADPERIVKPVCGGPHGGTTMPRKGRSGYPDLSEELWANVIDDFHPYWGWYGWAGDINQWCKVLPADRLVTVGEYGGEALDSYETMVDYGTPTKAPPKDADALLGNVQVRKTGVKQIFGFRGKTPGSLGEYIEASQNYQADILSETTKGWRLSTGRIAGYMQFHFVDVTPAYWPKSIVSHDLRPKKAYYEMAQINQPIVPLPRVTQEGREMEVWVANNLNRPFADARVRWTVQDGAKVLAEGEASVDVPSHGAVQARRVDLSSVPAETPVVKISLALLDSKGAVLSGYERDVYLKGWRQGGAKK